MDLQLVRNGVLDYARRKKRWVLLLAAFSFSSYGVYKVCNLPSIVRKRRRVSKLLGALVCLAEVISNSAETIGVVSRDFKEFLQSESYEIPNSLKQISKLARSSEFSESVVTLTQALTAGILRGYQSNSRIGNELGADPNCPSFLDMVFDKLSSPAGTGLVSAVVGSFARNMVLAFYEGSNSGSDEGIANVHVDSQTDSVSRMVDVVCGDKCKALVGDSIQLFVSTAVAVYLEKTMNINTYDEFFAGMTNPKHEKKVKEVMVSVCNNAIETLVKTSHHVLTATDSHSKENSPNLATKEGEEGGFSVPGTFPKQSKLIDSFDESKDSGWVGKVSTTLAVPSNRRLVLDVTGTITFETVRSFLEFLLEKIYNGLKWCAEVVHETVIDSSIAVVRYVTAKSSVLATICLSLSLRILDGGCVLVPA